MQDIVRAYVRPHGQIAVAFALLSVVLMLLVGLVADVGLMLIYYRIGQTTVDGAAYAAATQLDELAFVDSNEVLVHADDACTLANDYAAQNGRGRVSIGCSVAANRVTISGQVSAPMLFMALAGIRSVSFDLQATAELKYGITEENQ